MYCYQKVVSMKHRCYPIRVWGYSHPSPRLPTRMTATITTFDFGDEHEKKKTNKSDRRISKEVQKQMELLNTLFYDSHLVTGRELFEILQDKLCEPYKVSLEKIHGKIVLVITPKIIANNVEYIQELENVARDINDLCNGSRIKNLLKSLPVRKRGISSAIIIPLQDTCE